MNINSLNNVQNFSVLKNNKTDNTVTNPNFKAQDTVENPQKQMVNAQMILAYKIPNLSFKGSVQNDILSDEEFEKFKNIISEFGKSSPKQFEELNSLQLNEEQAKYLKNKVLRQFIAQKAVKNLLSNSQNANKPLSDKQLNDKIVDFVVKISIGEFDNEQLQLLDKVLKDEKCNDKLKILYSPISEAKTTDQKELLVNKIMPNEEYFKSETFVKYLYGIVKLAANKENLGVLEKTLDNKNLYDNNGFMSCIFSPFKNEFQCKFLKEFLANEKLLDSKALIDNLDKISNGVFCQEQLDIALRVISDEDMYKTDNLIENLPNILEPLSITWIKINEYGLQIINKVLDNPQLYKTENITNNLADILKHVHSEEQLNVVNTITDNRHFYDNENLIKNLGEILKSLEKIGLNENNEYELQISQVRLEVLNKILNNEKYLDCKQFMECVPFTINKEYTDEQIEQVLELSNKELETNQIYKLVENPDDIKYEDIVKLNKIMGRKQASKLSVKDTKFASKFIDTYKKENINEISRERKKKFLKELVASDNGLFNISDEMKEMFPIIPANEKDFCKLLPSVVRSLGFDTNVILDKHFDEKLNHLGETLSKISDEDFKKLDIKQEYSKDNFITDVLDKVKDLPKEERQKVYDYFGFELHHNKNASFKTEKGIGYSITGYPMNLNNGEKLAEIKDTQTKAVIEDLRSDVERFTKNNKITCENKELEQDINNIIKVLPELRPSIGCIQAGMNGTKGSHQFDIFTHSLKVMQGIVQNPEYQQLNDSDKKIMLLASLLHDITKIEGATDKRHADNSSFDASFIIKKFNLSQEDEIKLYTLIKNHEWLSYVNTATSEEERTKRQQSVAYDLRHDNLFDMSLIFTHADLKGVNDEFADIKNENRNDFEGITRSYSEAADFYAKKIKKYIEKLKPSQPLLPVTPIPKASDIEKAITKVNEDGSTSIKGVYKDKDGLIVIKYNELRNEDLEKIGFPKGSMTKGIDALTSAGENVDTGNVKFFVHGLDYPNQLAKFDAFSLVNSNVLLSVSYAERPESKYRFFRPQGILLDVDTKYIHGGGETDSGSGCGKSIKDFKNRYIFGGEREKDRKYVSNLIKTALNMNDEEYKNFVDKYKNVSFSEIEPKETREKLIKAFSEINSNTRRGKREYNEMYISNPKPPMAVFAYAEDYNEKIDNPLEFLNRGKKQQHESKLVKERTEFLRQYALENNIPFIIFGD